MLARAPSFFELSMETFEAASVLGFRGRAQGLAYRVSGEEFGV